MTGEVSLIDVKPLQISIALFAISATLRPSNVLLSIPLVFILIQKLLQNIKSAATALESTFALIVLGRNCLAIG